MEEGRQQPSAYGIGDLFWLTSDAIVGADLSQERIALWNPAAERIFGYAADEALGMPLDALVPDAARAQHTAGIRRYRDGGEAVLVGAGAVEVSALTKTGEHRDVALTLTDLSDSAGRSRVVAVIRDVTAQRQAERASMLASDALRDFVAAASHDLRSPLAAVEGYADLLVEHGEEMSAAERSEGLTTILRSARSAIRMVSDLAALSQVHARAVVTHQEVVPLADAARAAAIAARVDTSVLVDESLSVFVDRHHLERMLVNYLSNASRYGVPPVAVVATPRGDQVDVRVCDRGTGPPDDFRDRLFDSFARATPGVGEGTGLGLAVVKGLAEANGGSVFYEQHEQLGTCFGLLLAAAKR